MLPTEQSWLPWETVDLVQGPEPAWKNGETVPFCNSKLCEALMQPERLPTTSVPKAKESRERRRQDSPGAPTRNKDLTFQGWATPGSPETQTPRDGGVETRTPGVCVKVEGFSRAIPEGLVGETSDAACLRSKTEVQLKRTEIGLPPNTPPPPAAPGTSFKTQLRRSLAVEAPPSCLLCHQILRPLGPTNHVTF